jgi:hypothetical protein
VQRNLKKALIALRATDAVKNGCMIWVDALSINQANMQEKNLEIPKMGDLYKKSWRVAMWLGDASRDSDEAMDFVNQLSEVWMQGVEATRAQLKNIMSSKCASSIWASLSESISRPLFSRVWIIQEVAMSCEGSLVLCGTKVTTGGRMQHVYHSLRIFDTEKKGRRLTQTLKEEILSRPAVVKAFRSVPT